MRSISARVTSPILSLPIRERPRREAAAPSRAPMKLDVTFDVPLDKGVGDCLSSISGRIGTAFCASRVAFLSAAGFPLATPQGSPEPACRHWRGQGLGRIRGSISTANQPRGSATPKTSRQTVEALMLIR